MTRQKIYAGRDRKICEAYLKEEKLGDIAAQYGVTKNHIYVIANLAGIHRPKVLMDARNNKICKLYKEGVGPAEITFRLNITKGVVSGVLFRAGIQSSRPKKTSPLKIMEKALERARDQFAERGFGP